MTQQLTQVKTTYLNLSQIPLESLTSSAEIRYTYTDVIKTLLQLIGYTVTTDTENNHDALPNLNNFLHFIPDSDRIYKASLSRQFAADLPHDVEQTSLKDEPKNWFIKTADYGDECDRVLQHRDGEFTQLLEDIARYHQKFQEGYNKVILIRPSLYSGYDIQLTAAMQCLGYTKEQFQFIVVQPIKLYAFHKPTQRVNPIPDLAPQELIQAIGMDALRWYSLRVPLNSVPSINISIAGQPTPADSLYRVQSAHARCCNLLQQAHQQKIVQLDTIQRDNWQISPAPMPMQEYSWDSPEAQTLASLLQAVPDILQQSPMEIAPHLVVLHLEAIAESCHRWLDTITLTPSACALLLVTKQTIFDLLENTLNITAPESLNKIAASACSEGTTP